MPSRRSRGAEAASVDRHEASWTQEREGMQKPATMDVDNEMDSENGPSDEL
jgi:hypothetical protein